MGSLAAGWGFPMPQPIHQVWWRWLWAALRWQLGHLGHLGQVLFAGGALCRVSEVHGRVLSWEEG
jgi:hypothetical protein